MINTKSISFGKFEQNSINEDAVIARKNLIAVSDGAGGGGLFANKWSAYLLRNLPTSPITSAEQLDEWIANIWEKYYNKAEISAKRLGGMALDKFYDEGSFATLAAVWYCSNELCRWMTYGDSVVFHYDYNTKKLSHSFTALKDFSNYPFLVNCKDELDFSGFRTGEFNMTSNSLVFVASDALSHYILMMYEISQNTEYSEEIIDAIKCNSKNSNYLRKAESLSPFRFEKEVIDKLRKAASHKKYCKKWLRNLYDRGLLALDDYSLALMF